MRRNRHNVVCWLGNQCEIYCAKKISATFFKQSIIMIQQEKKINENLHSLAVKTSAKPIKHCIKHFFLCLMRHWCKFELFERSIFYWILCQSNLINVNYVPSKREIFPKWLEEGLIRRA